MKIQVAKCDLDAAVGVVANSLNTSGTDITSHIVFRADEDGNVTCFTFAGRLFSEAPVKCVAEGFEDVNAFTVEGARLIAWTKAAKDAALELTYDANEKIVTATSPRGSMEFESLNPDNFPFWDGMWDEVKEVGTVNAANLLAALSYSRSFCFEKETKKPQLCLIECRDGMLWATDEKAISLVEIEGLEESHLRIHRNDAAGVQKFLGTCGDKEVVLMEHDRSLLFKRGDGAVFGETRFTAQYPNLKVNREGKPSVWWKLSLSEIMEGIPYLRSGAKKEDPRLFFNREDDGPVLMGCMAATANLMNVGVSVLEDGAEDGATLPEGGFMLNYTDLLKVLNQWEGDEVVFSIHFKEVKGVLKGYVRFREKRGDIDFLTILSWLD